MNVSIVRAAFAAGMMFLACGSSYAAGDGLDPTARQTGNTTFAGQHVEAARVHGRRIRAGRYYGHVGSPRYRAR